MKQWINSKERQHEIVKSCHADKLGRHFGWNKTREKVTSRFVIYLINIHGLYSADSFLLTLSADNETMHKSINVCLVLIISTDTTGITL